MNWNQFGVAALVALVAGGCGPKAEFSPERTADFPTQAELEELMNRDLPQLDVSLSAQVLQSWELRNPARGEAGFRPVAQTTDVEDALISRVADAQVDNGARCVSEEMLAARIEGEIPDRFEQEWIQRRCGLSTGYSRSLVFSGQSASAVASSVESLVARWEGPLALGHASGETYDVVTIGEMAARVEPFDTSGDTFTIRGEFTRDVGWFRGVIAHGDFDAAPCDIDTTVDLPEFSMTCPAVASDSRAMIQVVAGNEGRFLGEQVFETWTSPDGSEPTSYTRESILSRAGRIDVEDTEALTAETVLASVNAIRASAGREPMRLHEAQSAAASGLMPQFLTDQMNPDSSGAVADTIASGVLAGWSLDVRVTDGSLTYRSFLGDETVATMMARSTDEPSLRQTLLEENLDLLAVGVGEIERPSISGFIIAAYDTYAGGGVGAVRERLIERMNEYRTDRDLPEMRGAGSRCDDAAIEAVTRILDGDDAMRAFNSGLRNCAYTSNSGAGGYILQLLNADQTNLERMADFLDQDDLRVSMALAMWPDPNSAWGTFVAVIYYKQ